MSDTTRRHPTTYGWRAKIGLIVPPTNTVNEAEWNIMAPEGISLHTTRMPLHIDTTSEAGERALYDDIEKATSDVGQTGCDVVAYGCTAGSMSLPLSKLSDFMATISGGPCVTTAASIVAALAALAVDRISVATPYNDALNEHEASFLASVGVEVVHIQGLGIGADGPGGYTRIAKTPADEIFDHAVSADRPEARALLISCTDFPVMEMIPELEKTLGKPVITSNQATFWAALQMAKVKEPIQGYGRLLSEP